MCIGVIGVERGLPVLRPAHGQHHRCLTPRIGTPSRSITINTLFIGLSHRGGAIRSAMAATYLSDRDAVFG